MKKTKIIIPALGMLLLSTAASVSGTVAWFSMNTTVSVSGMTARTKVSSNLQISDTYTDASFSTDPLLQNVDGTLEPVSSINGIEFFYHSASQNVNGNGTVSDALFPAYAESDTLDSGWTVARTDASAAGRADFKYSAAFNTNYGHTVDTNSTEVYYGYIDYVFYLKATTSEANQQIAVTTCSLAKADNSAVTDYAWRIAVMAHALSAADTDYTSPWVAGDVKSLLGFSGASYNDGKAVANVSSTGTLTTVPTSGNDQKYQKNAVIDTIANAGTTVRYKVTVRLFLEGNDAACTNDVYAPLSDVNYSLALSLKLGNSTEAAGVTAISSAN